MLRQPQCEGEVWILFYNKWQSFMVSDMVKLVLIHQRHTSQIRGRRTNSLEIDAVNQERGNKSLNFGGSNEDIAKDDRS